MASLPDRFRGLQERFLRIHAGSVDDGVKAVRRIAALANRLYLESREGGHLRKFGPPHKSKDQFWSRLGISGEDYSDFEDERQWHHLCVVLSAFESDVSSELGKMIGFSKNGVTYGEPRQWRQRAEDYATVCRLLADEIQNTPPKRRCRLRIERSAAHTLAVLDDGPHEVSDTAADFIAAMIDSEDWTSMGEFGCKSRHLDALPPPIKALIERETAKGCRLVSAAWLN